MTTSSFLRVSQGWGSFNDDLTVEAWVRIDRMPTSGQRAAILDEELRIGLFVMPGGTLVCSTPSADATASNALTTGEWAAIRDQRSTSGISSGNAATLGIGGNLPSGDPLEGLMDNVRVWNRARTAQELCDYAPACR